MQGIILADYTNWNAWMTPLIVGGSLTVAALLVWWRLAHAPANVAYTAYTSAPAIAGGSLPAPVYTPPRNSFVDRMGRSSATVAVVAALGVALLLIGPATWVGVSLTSGAVGALPTAGPTATLAQSGGNGGFGGGPQGFGGNGGGRGFAGGGFPGGGFTPPTSGQGNGPLGSGSGATGGAGGAGAQSLQVNQQLLTYLEANRGSARYLLATPNSQTAAPYIIASGQPVIALGGFNGNDQILTLSQLQALVNAGDLRYFLLDGAGGGPGGQGGGNNQLLQWVESNCTQVAASAYGGSTTGGALYACSTAG